MVIFHSKLLVYQRVKQRCSWSYYRPKIIQNQWRFCEFCPSTITQSSANSSPFQAPGSGTDFCSAIPLEESAKKMGVEQFSILLIELWERSIKFTRNFISCRSINSLWKNWKVIGIQQKDPPLFGSRVVTAALLFVVPWRTLQGGMVPPSYGRHGISMEYDDLMTRMNHLLWDRPSDR